MRAISKGRARLTEKDYAYLGSSSPLKRISSPQYRQKEREREIIFPLVFARSVLLMPVKTRRGDEREECQNSGIGGR